MALSYSETFALAAVTRSCSNTGRNYTSYQKTPSWPAPFPTCTIAFSPYETTKLIMEWTDNTSQISIVEGTLSITNSYEQTLVNFDFAAGNFPPSTTGCIVFKHSSFNWANNQYCKVKLSIVLDDSTQPKKGDYAETFAASMVSRVPNDVCIHFPRTGQSLWANETILKKASPYLASLLSSGFSEDKPASKDDGTSGDKAMIDPFEFEDSDEESDQMTLSESTGQASDFGVAKFKRIDVTQATYTTYANVLCWIGSGYISFAPLKSTTRFPSTTASPKKLQPPSSLPTPASPKSVYRLAHLLELPDLVDLALGNFKKQLTTQNVAYELYTDVASTYPQIRDLLMNYAVEHWKEVVKSDAYKEVRQKAETEGVDSWTGMLLMEKLAAR